MYVREKILAKLKGIVNSLALNLPHIVPNYETPRCSDPTFANASWEEVEKELEISVTPATLPIIMVSD